MTSTYASFSLSPEAYEHQNVHTVYEAIAPHFSRTRYKPWPVVDRFLRNLEPGAVGIDVGCGNGKYLGVNPNVVVVGSDRSEALVSIAAQRYHSHPTSTQQAATSHRPSSVDTGSRPNHGSEEGLRGSNRPQPELQKRSRQGHASHEQLYDGRSGRKIHNERQSSRQLPDRQHRTRQSPSHQDLPDHQINQRKLDQHPDRGRHNIPNDQPSSNTHDASSSGTNSKVGTATVIVADTLALPHPDRTFDFAICIAVIHHLSTRERRVQSISDILSKLRIRSRDRSSGGIRAIRRSEREDLSRSPHREDAGDADVRSGKSDVSHDGESQKEMDLPKRHWDEDRDAIEPNLRHDFLPEEGRADGSGRSSDDQPGQALIFVWALEQKSSRRGFDEGDSQDQLVPWVLKQDLNAGSMKQRTSKLSKASSSAKMNEKKQCSSRSEAEPRNHDCWDQASADVDASAGVGAQRKPTSPSTEEKTFHRFYHLYQEGELEGECAEAGASLVERGYDRDNWWVVVEPGREEGG